MGEGREQRREHGDAEKYVHLLWPLLVLVSQHELLGELVQLLRVLRLEFGSLPKVILDLCHDGALSVYAIIEPFQLLVQLLPDVCNRLKELAVRSVRLQYVDPVS